MDMSSLLAQCIQNILKQRLLTGVKILFVGALLISNEALSANRDNSFPLVPGTTITGLAGREIVGQFDSMVPTLGDPTDFFYLDPQFSFHQGNDYSGAFGLGYRWLSEELGILGMYVFADYDHSPNNNHFWFVSPGIERLGDSIDFSMNAYIPVSSQQKFLGAFQGTQIGENQFVSFHGHDQFDALFRTSESVGFGADVEVGYRLPIMNSPKIFLGSYYADPKDADNIWGGVLGVEVPLTDNVRVSLSEAYDNLDNNTVKFGLSVDLGGRHTHKDYNKCKQAHECLATRMLDPIQRNLILVRGSSVTNQAIVQNVAKSADSALVRSNISFFEPIGTDPGSLQDGTFENPYQGLDQAHVNDGNSQGNTNFYFNTGTYLQNNVIQFTNDSIYGRQTFNGLRFAIPAVGSGRPLFDFSAMSPTIPVAFNMLTNADTTIDAISMLGNDASTAILMNANAVRPINVTFSNIAITHFANAIDVQNTGNIKQFLLTNAVISNNTGIGLNFVNQGAVGDLAVENSTLNANSTGVSLTNDAGDIGNVVFNASTMNNNNVFGLFISNINNAIMDTLVINNANVIGNQIPISIFNDSVMGLTTIMNSFVNQNIAGINFENSGASATMADVRLENLEVNNNSFAGLVIYNHLGAQMGTVLINDSTLNDTKFDNGVFIRNTDANTSLAGLSITNSIINGNGIGFAGNGVRIVNDSGANLGDATISNSNMNANDNVGFAILNRDVNTIMGNILLSSSDISNNVNGFVVANILSAQLGDITLNSVTANNNTNLGVSINNSELMGNILISNSTVNNNVGDGIFIGNSNIVSSITFNTITALTNGGFDININNTGGTITNPGGDTVLVNAASIIGTENCTNCTFVVVP